jgi:hypothetical protein
MPIFSSLGALAYPRTGVESNAWEYWTFLTRGIGNTSSNRINITSSFFDTSSNVFFGGSRSTTASDELYIAKIDTSVPLVSPTISFVDGNIRSNTAPTAGLGSVPGITKFVEYSNNIISIATATPTNQESQLKFSIDPSTGGLSNASLLQPNIANSSYVNKRDPLDIVFDNTGNYTIIGEESTRTIIANVEYIDNQPYIIKYNSSGNVIFSKYFGSNANVETDGQASRGATFEINIDSSNNYRIVTNHGIANTFPAKNIIANIDSTFTTVNWQKTLSDSNALTMFDSITVNNNTYVSLYDDTLPPLSSSPLYISKIDNNGNVVWDKKILFGNVPGGAPSSIYEDNGNIYICGYLLPTIGLQSSRIGLCSLNSNTGNLSWQRQFTFTSANFIYSKSSDTPISISVKDDILLLGSSLSQVLISNTSVQTSIGTILALPSNGDIPGSGVYDIGSNITLTYSVTTEAILSNANLIISTANCVILNTKSANYFNPITLSIATVNINPEFSRLV